MQAKALALVIGLISGILYYLIFYHLDRYNSVNIVLIYTLLFSGYLFLLHFRNRINVKHIIALGVIFRLISIASIPSMSDDFYRFIWDGILWSNGINPFALIPQEVVARSTIPITPFVLQVFDHLNSQITYTVYPTIPQAINLLAYKIAGEHLLFNVIIQRGFIISAEILAIYFMAKILQKRGMNQSLMAFYILNPLVIIELAANLHHEALMIAFFLGFIYMSLNKKNIGAGIMLAFSIGSKLLPLMFLPLIILNSPDRKKLTVSILITSIVLLLPLVDYSFIHGMSSSLTLYYQKFEFNAGLYFIVREIGYWFYGYNAIALIGNLFLIISFLLIAITTILGFKRGADQFTLYTIIYLIFAMFSLILHPWYIMILIALTPFTKFRFCLIWSFLIFFTYIGYSRTGFNENYVVVFIEYLALAIAIFFDWRNQAFERATLNDAP